jgi:hypothetical protein
MQLGLIALRIRASQSDRNTNGDSATFWDSINDNARVFGSAELVLAQKEGTLLNEAAFVVPLADNSTPNREQAGINQIITENFGVVVALKNDTNIKDELGITSYDRIAGVRTELWAALVNWQPSTTAYSLVQYGGGSLQSLNRAWIWYLFNFSYQICISENDGYDNEADSLPNLVQFYTQYTLGGDPNLPITTGIPTNLLDIDMTQIVKINHAFGDGFATGFDTVDKDRQGD